jgi:hypothetical protein
LELVSVTHSISEVRREVAAKLRGPFDVCECVGHTYINGTLYGMQVCARDELALRDGMRHLADLIDPTCGEWRDDPHPIDPAGFTEDDSGLWCEHCDIPLNPDYRYCPYCGSRVVSDDGE